MTPCFPRPAEYERRRGIEHTLSESEYELVSYKVEAPRQRDAALGKLLRRERTDSALIIVLSPRDNDLDRLAHWSVPVVLIDTNHDSLTTLNRVVVDDVAGGRMATRHLIDLGHRRIGRVNMGAFRLVVSPI